MEIKELTTIHDLKHLLQQDVLFCWLMGGVELEGSQKFKGKAQAGECTKLEKNGEETGGLGEQDSVLS